ncbi:MAG: sigma-70 family RNA polymerase sigma factor, partial [Bacillota bacterium]
FRGESAVKTWLVRITLNLCRDRTRGRAAHETPADPVALDRACPLDLEAEAMARLERTAVLKEVLALPWPYQEALYLYYYLDLDVRETARAMAVPEGTVRTRLHRARALLKDRLEKGGWNRGDD